MVLAVPDEPARGRKPVLRDELAAVAAKQQYPRERLGTAQILPEYGTLKCEVIFARALTIVFLYSRLSVMLLVIVWVTLKRMQYIPLFIE
jgi:hypothetical protein